MDELFKNNGLKITNQRKQVIEVINKLGEAATLKNIIKEVKKVDKSTIYRILDLLINKNILEKRINYNEEIYYSIKEEHGHYFNCISCHKKEKIDACPLKEIEKQYEKEKGYLILNHTIYIDGICNDCQKKI